jgi:hypothetical protein
LTIEPDSGEIRVISGAGDAGRASAIVAGEGFVGSSFTVVLLLEEFSAHAVSGGSIRKVVEKKRATNRASVILRLLGRTFDAKRSRTLEDNRKGVRKGRLVQRRR